MKREIVEGNLGIRMAMALASFYGAGVVAFVVMAGSLRFECLWWAFSLAAIGMLFGPIAFVIGVHGLAFGYGSGTPTPWAWAWVALAYAGYVGLFLGSVLPKNRGVRMACLMIEALCALVAAKGVSFCV